MKPVSRRTLDWIYSVVGPRSGELYGVYSLGWRAEGPVFLQRPETLKPIPESSISLPPLDSASSWRTRSSAPYVRTVGRTRLRNSIYSFVAVTSTLATYLATSGEAGQEGGTTQLSFSLLLPLSFSFIYFFSCSSRSYYFPGDMSSMHRQ